MCMILKHLRKRRDRVEKQEYCSEKNSMRKESERKNKFQYIIMNQVFPCCPMFQFIGNAGIKMH